MLFIVRLLGVAYALGAGFVLAGPAAAGLPVIHPGQMVHLSGTRVYCYTLVAQNHTYVACEVIKPPSQVPPFTKTGPQGYTFAIGDQAVVVDQIAGSNVDEHTVFAHDQPSLQLSPIGATGRGTGTIEMRLGDQVVVGGTHMTLVAGKNAEHEPDLVAAMPDTKGRPRHQTYIAEISEGRVAILVSETPKATPVFKALQPKG